VSIYYGVVRNTKKRKAVFFKGVSILADFIKLYYSHDSQAVTINIDDIVRYENMRSRGAYVVIRGDNVVLEVSSRRLSENTFCLKQPSTYRS
jgi:hypothetical protein